MRKVATLDRGLAYGEACFETFRVVDGNVFALPEHEQRLTRAAAQFAWKIDASALFKKAIKSAKTEGRDVLLRLTLTGGKAPWGVLPTGTIPAVYLQVMPASTRSPLHLRMVDCGSISLRNRDVKHNSDYADMLRIYQQSRHQLGSNEQMLFCAQAKIISTMTANILCYHDGQWITPEDDHLLTGIVRHLLLQKGVISVGACWQKIAKECEAMACINSGLFIQAVVAINAHVMTVEGKIFQPLYDFFRGQAGVPLCL
ncbi:MAG: aminotransferase class IV [Mariprofundaceae bacterium]|nr:aminotransferase class IV [Mariprofundaceae bacterium]